MLSPASFKDSDFIVDLLSENGIIHDLFFCPNLDKKKYSVKNIVSSLLSATDYLNQFLYIIVDEHQQERQGIVCATIRGDSAEIGCVVSKKVRGKGIGYLANELMFKKILTSCPNITTFLAETNNNNFGAIRTLLALGFQQDFSINKTNTLKKNRLNFRKSITSK